MNGYFVPCQTEAGLILIVNIMHYRIVGVLREYNYYKLRGKNMQYIKNIKIIGKTVKETTRLLKKWGSFYSGIILLRWLREV